MGLGECHSVAHFCTKWHQSAAVDENCQNSQISFKVRFKFKDGFRTVPKLFLDHLGALKKVFEIFEVKKPILELESHFEKSMKFAAFGNSRLRQRTDVISCKSGPLKSTLQGSQR